MRLRRWRRSRARSTRLSSSGERQVTASRRPAAGSSRAAPTAPAGPGVILRTFGANRETGLQGAGTCDDAGAMRLAPRNRARRTTLALAALAVLAAGTVTGCGSVGDGQQLTGQTRLINDLSGQMASAGSLTYTAVYSLPRGASATVVQAQDPVRAAYTYPGGKLVLTPERTADCRLEGSTTTCTVSPPPSPAGDPAALRNQVGSLGLIAPAEVINLLGAAAVDADTEVSEHDTTISGEHATCLDVRDLSNAAASTFTACITTAGLLGSFSGTVGAAPIDITLQQYRAEAGPDAFALPPGAKIIEGHTG